MNKSLVIISWVTIVSAFMLLAVVFGWLLFPYKIISFEDEDFPIINTGKVVKVGDSLIYQVNYCKYSDLQGVVSRSFIDEIIFPMQRITTDRPKGCGKIQISVEVPTTLLPDTYHLEIRYSYQVNPIRTVIVTKNTEEFTLVR